MSNMELSSRFFLELAVILIACRALTWLGRRALQPPVVCEMVAGVLLGPSLFGLLAPGLQAMIFPKETMPLIFAVSQVGLTLYMFVVGLEFRLDLLSKGWRGSAAVSISGIAAPLALGAILGSHLMSDPQYFGAGVKSWQAMIFTGAAMSITAFPMLARIIMERGLAGTRIGTLSLGAGAFDDAAAWTLLAVILAAFESDPRIAVLAIAGGAAYLAFVAFVARPASKSLVARHPEASLSPSGLGAVFILLMLAAWFTDYIRLHAVFGAFLLGVVMPKGTFNDALRDRIEPLTSGLLVPFFVAFVARPLSKSIVARHPEASLSPSGLGAVFIVLMLAAWYTDYIRLHAVFGAFLLGVVMPKGTFADTLRDRIEPLTSGLLVPLFFAFSGLNTRLDLMAGPGMWGIALTILLIATLGKGVACGVAARLGGYPAAEAVAVGTLMNARGLMELILLNIGLERGLITPTLFTMMVLMAVVTTLAASPVFELVRPYLNPGEGARRPSPAKAR